MMTTVNQGVIPLQHGWNVVVLLLVYRDPLL